MMRRLVQQFVSQKSLVLRTTNEVHIYHAVNHCRWIPSVPRRLTLTTKRSVIMMAMSVTVGFMVCFTPFFIVTSVRVYSDYQYPLTTAKLISSLMVLSHSAVNPVLYIISSKRAVHAAFDHLCQRAQPSCCHR